MFISSASPGSNYIATLVDVTPGDSIAFTDKRIDICKWSGKKCSRTHEDGELTITEESLGPNQLLDRWPYLLKKRMRR